MDVVSADAFLHTQLVCTGNVVGSKSIVEPGGGVDLHIGHPGQPMVVAGECLGCKMAPFVRKAWKGIAKAAVHIICLARIIVNKFSKIVVVFIARDDV